MNLLHGDCLETLRSLEANSLDSLVTDPPAGIAFMGADWDDDKGGRKQWIAWMTEVMTEALRVLKPGAHGLVWALPRTSHWTATALEDAGFEVRDVVTHLFGSGFPKSMNVAIAIDKQAGALKARGKAFVTAGRGDRADIQEENGKAMPTHEPITDDAKKWQGWGTALKPASEHWILVRKPCSEKTVAANVLKWGTGALNIDASRVEMDPKSKDLRLNAKNHVGHGSTFGQKGERSLDDLPDMGLHNSKGRFPANLVLDEGASRLLDAQAANEVSRFFYVAKASKRDKNAGLEGSTEKRRSSDARPNSGDYTGKFPDHDHREKTGNFHPTVKSTALMTYLIRMVTPPGGVVLDPFMGSGSTGVSAVKAGFKFLGIERDESYFEIASKRVGATA